MGDPVDVVIRPERAEDHDEIRSLVMAAFGSQVQPDLVDRLRTASECVGDMALVACAAGAIAGHVMVSHATVRNADGDRQVAMLSPLAVAPAHQRRGIGSALVAAVVAVAEQHREPLIVVEGSPAYYGRLGFELALRHGIEVDLPAGRPRKLLRSSCWMRSIQPTRRFEAHSCAQRPSTGRKAKPYCGPTRRRG